MMTSMVFLLFVIAAIVLGIEAIMARSLVALGLCLMAIAFAVGAWHNVT